MKVYVTNSGLGYNQFAYFVKTKDGLLVIDTVRCYDDSYTIGTLIPNNEAIYIELENSKYDIKDSPLYNTYLFRELLFKELSLEEIINLTKINQKYYILEKTNKENNETTHFYSLAKDDFILILEQEKDNKDRLFKFRLFSKNKEGISFVNELTTMNNLQLIAWLG